MAPRRRGRRAYPYWPWGQPGFTPQSQGPLGPLGPLGPPPYPAGLPVFPAGYGPASDLDSLIVLPLLFACQGVVFRAVSLGGQAIPGASGTVIAYDTILEDPFAGWSAAGTGTQAANSWQPPFDGIFEVTVSVINAAAGETVLAAGIGVSGAQFSPVDSKGTGGGITGGAGGSALKAMSGGGDYVQGFAWGTTGFNLASGNPSRATSMEIMLVSL